MISMLASSAVYREFELRSGQAKDYKIGVFLNIMVYAQRKRLSTPW
jgi:hypothetical protein